MKYPMKYVLDAERIFDIQLLANKLCEMIAEHHITDETLYKLLDYYTHNNTQLFHLRVMINNLKKRYNYIKGRRKYIRNNILTKVIAKQIIEAEKFVLKYLLMQIRLILITISNFSLQIENMLRYFWLIRTAHAEV
jgi:hypothetical protein